MPWISSHPKRRFQAQVTIALVIALVALVALVTFALAFRPVWWVRQVLMVDERPGDGAELQHRTDTERVSKHLIY